MKICIARRASGIPAHRCLPLPNPRCEAIFSRFRMNCSGCSNCSGSRFAELWVISGTYTLYDEETHAYVIAMILVSVILRSGFRETYPEVRQVVPFVQKFPQDGQLNEQMICMGYTTGRVPPQLLESDPDSLSTSVVTPCPRLGALLTFR